MLARSFDPPIDSAEGKRKGGAAAANAAACRVPLSTWLRHGWTGPKPCWAGFGTSEPMVLDSLGRALRRGTATIRQFNIIFIFM
jgi:hypothetical protein